MRPHPIRRPRAALLALSLAVLSGCDDGERVRGTPDFVAGELLTLKQNGGWCWFQDPRVVVDRDKLLLGTVAGTTGGGSLAGDIDFTTYDPLTRTSTTFALHPEMERDDHDAPSVSVLPDGRYLAMYTRHTADHLMRWRVSAHPGDGSAWDPERHLNVPGGRITYANTYVVPAESNRVYNFTRAEDGNPHVMTSAPGELDFELDGTLLFWDRGPATGAVPEKVTGYVRPPTPYVRYASNGDDTIHFLTTEDHPISYDTSLYHGYVRRGAVYDSFGEVKDPYLFDDHARSPVDFTRVFEGDADHSAWGVDLELDRSGNPVAVFSVERGGAPFRGIKDQGGQDHRYHYARFDGAAWHVHEMAYAGSKLYADQVDYTGLVAIDPRAPETVYISTNADPVTGEPLVSSADGARHHEIYRGHTRDLGATWAWTPITANSTVDNLRPVIPAWDAHTALVWLRGRYHHMTRYELDVVGLIDP
jgi:hypothetical protein